MQTILNVKFDYFWVYWFQVTTDNS